MAPTRNTTAVCHTRVVNYWEAAMTHIATDRNGVAEMGYETTLFVAEKYGWQEGRREGSVVVSVDLSKLDYSGQAYKVLSDARNNHEGDSWRLYLAGSKSGRTPKTDLYDRPISEVALPLLIEALKADAKHDNYRRLPLIISILDQFHDNPAWPKVGVFQYGH